MKKLSLLALLLLCGCYATSQPMFLPDGSSGYQINCGNYLGTMADCIQKAGDMCGVNGYQMYDQNGHPKSDESQNQTIIAALNNSSAKHDRSSDTPQSMFIKCKSNDAPLRLIPAPMAPQVETKPVPLVTKPAPSDNSLISPPPR